MENKNTNNPLQKYFRQPKLFIKLPSSGNFYPEGTLDRTENGEYAIYSMTAKDEIIIKTPDALLNGQATVDVIESCVPNIKSGWAVPSVDIDALLVAIRIATYGEQLDVKAIIPGDSDASTYETDLRLVLGKLLDGSFDTECKVNDELTVFLRPLSYAEFTKNAIKSTEEQRIMSLVNDDKLSDDEKQRQFAISFRKLTDVTMDLLIKGIVSVDTPDGTVTDQSFINEFINNTDKTVLKTIISHLEVQKAKFSIEPFKVVTTEEQRANGAPDVVEVPITLDASNFFG
jgi:hypothetical protein